MTEAQRGKETGTDLSAEEPEVGLKPLESSSSCSGHKSIQEDLYEAQVRQEATSLSSYLVAIEVDLGLRNVTHQQQFANKTGGFVRSHSFNAVE